MPLDGNLQLPKMIGALMVSRTTRVRPNQWFFIVVSLRNLLHRQYISGDDPNFLVSLSPYSGLIVRLMAYAVANITHPRYQAFKLDMVLNYIIKPEFHVNIKLSTFFSTGEEFLKNIPPEYHFKNKTHSFTSNWRRILGKLPIL